jgi:hypothetical protein
MKTEQSDPSELYKLAQEAISVIDLYGLINEREKPRGEIRIGGHIMNEQTIKSMRKQYNEAYRELSALIDRKNVQVSLTYLVKEFYKANIRAERYLISSGGQR